MATEKEERQQTSLDRVTIFNRLAEFKDRLKQLEEKVDKNQVMNETLAVGQSILCKAMESAGVSLDESTTAQTEPLKKVKVDAAYRKVDVEKLTGQLKSERRDSRSAKGPYYLARAEDNDNEAFRILQQKIKKTKPNEKGIFWSIKAGDVLWKFWFFNNDSAKICWRKKRPGSNS